MTILVVDDDTTLREMTSLLLQRKGYKVIQAADGEEAWEVLQEQPVQFVLTDRLMPRLDGQSLIRRIRAAAMTPYIYIVMLTAMGRAQEVVDGLEAGADDYIVKPFNLRELQARVAIGVRLLKVEQELREARDRLEILATYDDLTTLLNRKAITELAQRALNQVSEQGFPMSLILLDIDFFKKVNDQHGHLTGDQALKLIAQVAKQTVGPNAYAGRWGGEEFLLVLPNTSKVRAIEIAENVRINIMQSTLALANGKELSLSASLGVISAQHNHQNLPLDSFLQWADEALYKAKQLGRNRVCSSKIDYESLSNGKATVKVVP